MLQPVNERERVTFAAASRLVHLLPTRAILRPKLKRTMDLFFSAVFLFMLLPILLLISLVVWSDGGPILFRHRRVGQHGREFGCLKFRTMCVDSDRALRRVLDSDPVAALEWEMTRKLRNDPRVTRAGRVLRTTSLDELPQLLNILLGEMSLVGPRPVIREELDNYYTPAGIADTYLAVRPGLTGLWQIGGRNDIGYDERMALDAFYVRNPSLRTDFGILARTAGVVLRRHGSY